MSRRSVLRKSSNDKMATTVVEVSPAQALQWLEGNTHNRPVQEKRVRQYARDMANGFWPLTHQGIAFSPEGVLVDGQHRLWAVAESDVTVKMLVTTNAPMSSQLVIDDHRVRTGKDALALKGLVANAKIIATCNILLSGFQKARPTHSELEQGLKKYHDSLQFIDGAFTSAGSRRLTTAPVYAAVARAFYTIPVSSLESFCLGLCTGDTGELSSRQSRVLYLLRNFLMGSMPRVRVGDVRKDIYLRTTRALYAFWQDEALNKLFAARDELFPLDEDGDNSIVEQDDHFDVHTKKRRTTRKRVASLQFVE